jgi:hypothetical protein
MGKDCTERRERIGEGKIRREDRLGGIVKEGRRGDG